MIPDKINNNGIQVLNSQEVAKMLGVNVSTIKRWTDDGSLICNRTVGGHRKFLMAHLVDFVEKNKNLNPKVEVFSLENETDLRISFNIVKRNFEALENYVVDYALDSNRERVQRILSGLYLSQYPLFGIYDELVTPCLHRLGDLWQSGDVTVIEEHIATQTIRDSIIRMQGLIKLGQANGEKAVLMNPSDELHDLSLKMVDHILEERGFSVYFSGQITPVSMAQCVFDNYQPHRLYISSTYIKDLTKTQKEIDKLIELAKNYDVKIYVGGRGFDKITLPKNDNIIRLFNFKDVLEK